MNPKFKEEEHVRVTLGAFAGRVGTVYSVRPVTHKEIATSKERTVSFEYVVVLKPALNERNAGTSVNLDEAELMASP